VAPFESSFCNCFSQFTPTEIQVADLIRTGKTSKEIAGLLTMSLRSVHFHRNNIRKKLHIHGTKTNLRTFLMSLS
jgi:DNA-binding NarL/FixJ family response regulator